MLRIGPMMTCALVHLCTAVGASTYHTYMLVQIVLANRQKHVDCPTTCTEQTLWDEVLY